MKEPKFDLNDIVLIPAEKSDISSRKECVITNGHKELPLMAAPMDTVVSKKNYMKYVINSITPCIPRGLSGEYHISSYFYFQSFGLSEIEKQLEDYRIDLVNAYGAFYTYPQVLIDIANGHMAKLIPLIEEIKRLWPNIALMVGNVANPETFVNLGMAGADYVRCSIGTGCFIPGQQIKTDDIEKNIEKIEIGDKVLTHTGDYKSVKTKFEYEIDDIIYKINDIKCTSNHEFYVIEKQYENIVNDENINQYAKWISAKELNINKHLLIQY